MRKSRGGQGRRIPFDSCRNETKHAFFYWFLLVYEPREKTVRSLSPKNYSSTSIFEGLLLFFDGSQSTFETKQLKSPR